MPVKLKKGNLTMMRINQLSCHSCALSRDRTGTGLTPLVFETNASTNSAIRAMCAACNAGAKLHNFFYFANLFVTDLCFANHFPASSFKNGCA